MPGLVPGIHAFLFSLKQGVDGRDKPGHDERKTEDKHYDPSSNQNSSYCIGGGMGLATCFYIRIATKGSKFAVPASKLGMGYAYPGLKRLVDVVGPSFAMEIFYTARQFTAAEALAMGLVNRVVPDGELESFVKSYADMIAGNAPLTIKAVKAVVSEMMKDEKTRDLKRAQAAVDACFKSRDYEEGRKAFMEKRKPVFTGS